MPISNSVFNFPNFLAAATAAAYSLGTFNPANSSELNNTVVQFGTTVPTSSIRSSAYAPRISSYSPDSENPIPSVQSDMTVPGFIETLSFALGQKGSKLYCQVDAKPKQYRLDTTPAGNLLRKGQIKEQALEQKHTLLKFIASLPTSDQKLILQQMPYEAFSGIVYLDLTGSGVPGIVFSKQKYEEYLNEYFTAYHLHRKGKEPISENTHEEESLKKAAHEYASAKCKYLAIQFNNQVCEPYLTLPDKIAKNNGINPNILPKSYDGDGGVIAYVLPMEADMQRELYELQEGFPTRVRQAAKEFGINMESYLLNGTYGMRVGLLDNTELEQNGIVVKVGLIGGSTQLHIAGLKGDDPEKTIKTNAKKLSLQKPEALLDDSNLSLESINVDFRNQTIDLKEGYRAVGILFNIDENDTTKRQKIREAIDIALKSSYPERARSLQTLLKSHQLFDEHSVVEYPEDLQGNHFTVIVSEQQYKELDKVLTEFNKQNICNYTSSNKINVLKVGNRVVIGTLNLTNTADSVKKVVFTHQKEELDQKQWLESIAKYYGQLSDPLEIRALVKYLEGKYLIPGRPFNRHNVLEQIYKDEIEHNQSAENYGLIKEETIRNIVRKPLTALSFWDKLFSQSPEVNIYADTINQEDPDIEFSSPQHLRDMSILWTLWPHKTDFLNMPASELFNEVDQLVARVPWTEGEGLTLASFSDLDELTHPNGLHAERKREAVRV